MDETGDGEGGEVSKHFPHHCTCSGMRDGRGAGMYMVLCYTLPHGVAKMGGLVIGSVNRLLATSSGRWELQVIPSFSKHALTTSEGIWH